MTFLPATSTSSAAATQRGGDSGGPFAFPNKLTLLLSLIRSQAVSRVITDDTPTYKNAKSWSEVSNSGLLNEFRAGVRVCGLICLETMRLFFYLKICKLNQKQPDFNFRGV